MARRSGELPENWKCTNPRRLRLGALAVASLATIGCMELPSPGAGAEDPTSETRQSALATLPWQLVGPSGYYDPNNSGQRQHGFTYETKVFPADTGNGSLGIVRMASNGGIFEWCPAPQCPDTQWINLTQSLVPTNSPPAAGEGLSASSFASNPANGYSTIVFGTANSDEGSAYKSGIWRGTKSGSVWTWTHPLNDTQVGNVRRVMWGGGGFPSRVHAATETGYWRSDDDGATWTQFNTGCSGGFQLTDIVDYRGQYLLGVGQCSADSGWNLWKRAPNQNWTRVHALTADARYAWLGMGATNAYILVGRSDNTAVVERFDGTNYTSSTTTVPIGGQVAFGHNGAVGVDPTSDAIVYVGAQALARNTTFGSGTWTTLPVGHADFHELFFGRSFNLRALWASSDGGIHISTTYSAASPAWSGFYSTAPVSLVSAIDVANWNGDNWVHVQTWDAGMAHSIDDNTGGVSNGWTLAGFNDDGGIVTMDPATPGVVWATEALGNTGFMTTDNFQTSPVSMNMGGDFVHDQVPNVFLYAYPLTGNTIYRSTSPQTAPITWDAYATGPADLGGYNGFGVGRWNGVGSYIYISPSNLRGIWVATPDSTTFQQTSAPNLTFVKIHGWVSSDATAPQTAYALSFSTPPTVIRTRDGGSTWKNITGNLPQTFSVRDVVADTVNPDIVFVSVWTGGSGIYMTMNASAATPQWVRWVAGLPAKGAIGTSGVATSMNSGTQLKVLDLGTGNHWLYAGFWGGSAWKRRTDAHD